LPQQLSQHQLEGIGSVVTQALVREFIGIARALYAAFIEMGPAYDDQRDKLRGIGYQLQLALQRAGEGGPGTFKHRAAWLMATKAADDLMAMVDVYLPARTLLKATSERLAKKNR
jgi:hypothetical protein